MKDFQYQHMCLHAAPFIEQHTGEHIATMLTNLCSLYTAVGSEGWMPGTTYSYIVHCKSVQISHTL